MNHGKPPLAEIDDERREEPAPFHLFRRGPWEIAATLLIAAGVLMLMQPFALELFTWSFPVTLAGTVLFIVVSHFPD